MSLRNSEVALAGDIFANRCHGNRRLNFEGLGFGDLCERTICAGMRSSGERDEGKWEVEEAAVEHKGVIKAPCRAGLG